MRSVGVNLIRECKGKWKGSIEAPEGNVDSGRIATLGYEFEDCLK